METARCRAFLAAAETGSFTKAAEKLGYTPSGVSQLVNALESELGVPLLARNTRGVAPTADGEMFLPAVREFLSREDGLYQLASDIKGLEVGSVAIASYSSIATHWLPEVIGAFQREHPGIKISLFEDIRQEVMWVMPEEVYPRSSDAFIRLPVSSAVIRAFILFVSIAASFSLLE